MVLSEVFAVLQSEMKLSIAAIQLRRVVAHQPRRLLRVLREVQPNLQQHLSPLKSHQRDPRYAQV